MLMENKPKLDRRIRLLHPVYDAQHFLESHYWYAIETGTLLQYHAALRTAEFPVAAEPLQAFSDRSAPALATRPPILAGERIGFQSVPTDLTVLVLATRAACSAGRDEASAVAHDRSIGSLLPDMLAGLESSCAAEIVVLADRDNSWSVGLAPAGGAGLEGGRPPTRLLLAEPSAELGSQIGDAMEQLGERRLAVLQASVLADFQVADVLAFHERQAKLATVVMARPPSLPLALDAEVAESFDETPLFGEFWVRAGAMVLEPGTRSRLGAHPKLGDFVADLARDDQVAAYRHEGFWQEVRTSRDVAILSFLETPERSAALAQAALRRDPQAAPPRPC